MCHEKISKLATNTVKQKKMLFRNCFEYYNGILVCSVRPKPGFGIGNRNQDQVSVSVPKLLLPKPKLPPYAFPQIFFTL